MKMQPLDGFVLLVTTNVNTHSPHLKLLYCLQYIPKAPLYRTQRFSALLVTLDLLQIFINSVDPLPKLISAYGPLKNKFQASDFGIFVNKSILIQKSSLSQCKDILLTIVLFLQVITIKLQEYQKHKVKKLSDCRIHSMHRHPNVKHCMLILLQQRQFYLCC